MTPETAILVAIIVPLVGALAIALAGRFSANLREAATAITSISLIWVVWGLLPTLMDGGRPSIEVSEIMPGLSIAFTVEPLGMLFAALASGLWLINSIYSVGYMRGNKEKNQTRFFACFALALSATMGIAFAGNLFTLFLFYELLTLSTYPLVSHKGDAATVRSARIYLGVLLSTSIGLFLPAIIWTYSLAGTGDFTAGGILAGKLDDPEIGLLLGLFVFGIGKAAVMPVHKWLPAAMVAPTPVSALLHAVAVVKAGVFAITKIIVYVFGIDFLFDAPSSQWLVYVAAFTIVTASLVALRQTNIKRLLAYSTIAQLSYVVMAAAILKPLAEVGASLHMVAHAFGKITLFFAAGAIYVASKKTEVHQLRGIGRRMPWTMAAFTIGALSMIGVPPTGGFVSKWYILAGAFEANNLVAIFTIIASTVLNAAYFLPILYMAWFEREPVGGKEHGEAPFLAVLALCITAILTLAFFLFNGPVIELESQVVKGLN
ncbi:MAG: monovalent cation/H+ antiporter subunit D family protein [Paraglaciecola sp.]|uniref:monovalent cation/H+ antiporter subunit D family protein n=1 Tax=Paraglaciecola sp. TaxID=1920173 RepID=UPI00273DDD2E|nr:monovalent cation/H+ antiporter subunit D family protein [Paraglaciecola sp.]MDP5029936.1 monovalent cation/H+ antiporter subunit D family protein [Paraglaciecola sp.]MDP5130734.1 monovalent cation/H+ antiporter subunit D family protein [Paraglaciecola sp.]